MKFVKSYSYWGIIQLLSILFFLYIIIENLESITILIVSSIGMIISLFLFIIDTLFFEKKEIFIFQKNEFIIIKKFLFYTKKFVIESADINFEVINNDNHIKQLGLNYCIKILQKKEEIKILRCVYIWSEKNLKIDIYNIVEQLYIIKKNEML